MNLWKIIYLNMGKKMKSKKNYFRYFLSGAFIASVIFACSEVFLISITVSYPFDEDNPEASPSQYEIDINDGLEIVDSTLTKQTGDVTDNVAGPVKNELEKSIKNEFGENTEIVFNFENPQFKTEDFIDLIAGKNIDKSVSIKAVIKPQGVPEVERSFEETFTFNICDFDQNSTFSDDNVRMDIENISDFCKKSEPERENDLKYCLAEERTMEDLTKSCVYLKVRHENDPINIALSEVKDLKDYTKFMSKIYSATLNDLSFRILEAPDFNNDQEAPGFVLHAELFAQPTKRFLPDGSECSDPGNLECLPSGINEDGEKENYFSDDPDISTKYLVGHFGSESFEKDSSIELEYTYNGKDILQKSIKSLDFQIGAKSFYLFFPQAGRPVGKLSMDIKAKLLFTVEPLN
jgi:hypothetical protein